MALEIGSLLRDRYEIKDVLAHGGMGSIYSAVDISLGIRVAVKENLYGFDDSVRQFQKEASILAGLRHSHLPRVTDHFVVDGVGQYLVMDFVEGEDLKDILESKGIQDEQTVIEIGLAVADALSYLHRQSPPIIHRDIKPGNIKITPSQEIYLLDFGLAKQALAGEHTLTGAQALTPGFAPPEQYGQGTDTRSDIYSLGATLYAGLTNSTPCDGLARATGLESLKPIHSINPNIHPDLAAIIEKALAVDLDDRFQTADELKQALLSLRHGMLTRRRGSLDNTQTATVMSGGNQDATQVNQMREALLIPEIPVSTPEKSAAPAKKKMNWVLYLLGGGVIIVLGVVVGFQIIKGLLNGNGNGNEQTLRASETAAAFMAFLEETEMPEPTATELGTNTSEATSVSESEQNGDPTATATLEASATLEPTSTMEPVAVGTPVGGSGMIAFASDRENGIPQIFLYDLSDGTITQLTTIADGACQPDWSPSGDRIIYISPCKKMQQDYPGSRMFIINADGSGQTPLNSLPGGDFDPAWNPVDENLIAFTSVRSDSRPHIYLMNLVDQSVKKLSSTVAYDRAPAWSPDGQYLAYQTVYEGLFQIYYMNLDGSDKRELSRSQSESFAPAWSNQSGLVYYSQGDSMPWIGGRVFTDLSAAEIVLNDVRPIWKIDFSPDDFWLVFTSLGEGTNRDLFMMLSSGSGLTALTNDAAFEFDADWKP